MSLDCIKSLRVGAKVLLTRKSSRPNTAFNTTTSIIIEELIKDNRCVTSRELARAAKLPKSSVLR